MRLVIPFVPEGSDGDNTDSDIEIISSESESLPSGGGPDSSESDMEEYIFIVPMLSNEVVPSNEVASSSAEAVEPLSPNDIGFAYALVELDRIWARDGEDGEPEDSERKDDGNNDVASDSEPEERDFEAFDVRQLLDYDAHGEEYDGDNEQADNGGHNDIDCDVRSIAILRDIRLMLGKKSDPLYESIPMTRQLSDSYKCYGLVIALAKQFGKMATTNPSQQELMLKATRQLLGPRGLLHGWGAEIPMPMATFFNRRTNEYTWPWDCQSDSSYRSDSPGEDSERDGKERGPLGVVRGRPPVTGMTSSSEEDDPLNVNKYTSPWTKGRKMLRFYNFMASANRERRERRTARRARRIARQRYCDTLRRYDKAYDLEARRAELLAEERVHVHCAQFAEKKKLQKAMYTACMRVWDLEQNIPRLPRLGDSDNRIIKAIFEASRTERLVKRLRHQVSTSWRELYSPNGEDFPEDRNQMYHCWMTPIRSVTSPFFDRNGGLAALAMAARTVRCCEVAVGGAADGGTGDSKGAEMTRILGLKVRKAIQDAAAAEAMDESWRPSLDAREPPSVGELLEISRFLCPSDTDAVFGTGEMAEMAQIYQLGRYRVRIVVEDLDQVDGHMDDWWQDFSVVQRLICGQLVAVCYDAGENGFPTTSNGGGTAEWAILCGVIVGLPFGNAAAGGAKKPRYRKPKDFWRFDRKFHLYDDRRPENLDRQRIKVDKFGGRLNGVYFRDKPNGGEDPDADMYEDSEVDEDSELDSDDDSGPPSTDSDDTDTGDEEEDDDEEPFKPCTAEECGRQAVFQSSDGNGDGRVWVVARHGRNCDRYAVWPLDRLAASNRQLSRASETAEERAAAAEAMERQRVAEQAANERRAVRLESRQVAEMLINGNEDLVDLVGWYGATYSWWSDAVDGVVSRMPMTDVVTSLYPSVVRGVAEESDMTMMNALPPSAEALEYAREKTLRRIFALVESGRPAPVAVEFGQLLDMIRGVLSPPIFRPLRSHRPTPHVVWLSQEPFVCNHEREPVRHPQLSPLPPAPWPPQIKTELSCRIKRHIDMNSAPASRKRLFFPECPRAIDQNVAGRYIAFEPIRPTEHSNPHYRRDPLAAVNVHFTFERNYTVLELDTRKDCSKQHPDLAPLPGLDLPRFLI